MTALRYDVAALERELRRLAEDRGVQARIDSDWSQVCTRANTCLKVSLNSLPPPPVPPPHSPAPEIPIQLSHAQPRAPHPPPALSCSIALSDIFPPPPSLTAGQPAPSQPTAPRLPVHAPHTQTTRLRQPYMHTPPATPPPPPPPALDGDLRRREESVGRWPLNPGLHRGDRGGTPSCLRGDERAAVESRSPPRRRHSPGSGCRRWERHIGIFMKRPILKALSPLTMWMMRMGMLAMQAAKKKQWVEVQRQNGKNVLS